MPDKPVAVVTGANRGIGYETCRQLARAGLTVVLTSRAEDQGERAALALQHENCDVIPRQLDVTDATSVERLARWLESRFDGLDVLVNNAGVLLDTEGGRDPSVFHSDADLILRTFEINSLGAFRVARALVPLMLRRGRGRVINVSSGMGQLSEMSGGYPGYRMSKAALNALTRILADELKDSRILVNSVCPGWVRTDMGGPNATRSTEQGADTIVWLATMPDDGPTGGFFRDRTPIPW